MTETEALTWQIAVWAVCGALLLLNARGKQPSVGLPMAYFAAFALIHVPGATLYLDLTHNFYDFDTVREGFELSTWGAVAFTAGALLARTKIASIALTPKSRLSSDIDLQRWGTVFLVGGLGTQLVLMPLFGQVASLAAFLSGISSLSVVGVCLG